MRIDRIGALVAALVLAACSARAGNPFAPNPAPNAAGAATSAKPPIELYVANDGNAYYVNVYATGSTRLLRSIAMGFPFSRLTFDRAGDLYVLKCFHQTCSVQGFQPGKTTAWYEFRIAGSASDMVSSAVGDLYVASASSTKGWVSVYAPGSKKPKAKITGGIGIPQALQFDRRGNLYVEAHDAAYSEFISVYAPGASSPSRVIRQGLDNPGTMALDGGGNLYVTNFGSSGKTYSISVYPPGGIQSSYTIATGLDAPNALAFDDGDDLYVANSGNGTVAVFAPGATTPKHVIPAIEGEKPNALAFDPAGNLYVANIGRRAGSVVVYRPGLRLWYTIPQTNSRIDDLAFGPG